MKHLIETADPSGLGFTEYDRIILDSATNEIVYRRGGVTYEVAPDEYIYNETDNKYYQKLVGYGKPIKTNATVDLNSEWISDTTDDEYKYFKSNSIKFEPPFSQCKVTWSNLTSVTFKYMSNSDMGTLFVLKMDSEKVTSQTNPDVYLSTFDKTPGTYNEFTIECDKGEHHIWFCYVKNESATDEDRGFIGVPKSVTPILDVKQGAELSTEYKFGGVSAEGGKTYDISFNNVTLPNDNIVTVYKDFQKVEKTITYEYVNLGLKSGTLWATCNVGASSETDYGIYFPWGETSGISESLLGKYSDENYSWESYTLCNGSGTTLTKYCSNSSYGTEDNIETLESVDDAATQIMGSDWRMPTEAEFNELLSGTTNEWTQVNGVNGRKFTASNGNSIFIPAAGNCYDGSVYDVGGYGSVWSSSLFTSRSSNAWGLYFGSGNYNMSDRNRHIGRSVRGVRK